MKRNESYLKACTQRQVPTSVLVANARALQGKTEMEQDQMREEWAKEIEEKYPVKRRNDPTAPRNTSGKTDTA